MSNTFSTPRNQSALPVLMLGIAILLLEGYDLFVFGAVAPVLLEYEAWNVSPALIGIIGGLPPLSAPIGAVAAGYATDGFGRRLPMMVGLVWASACMFGSFVAPNLGVFMATRLAAGLALGALIPLTLSAVADQVPPRRTTFYICVTLTGIGGGGVLASLLGRALLPELQFQYMFLFGCMQLLLLPVVWRLIPSSESTMSGKEAASSVSAITESTEPTSVEPAVIGSGSEPQGSKLRQLFAPGLAGPTLGFWVASFLGLVLSFGVAIWLPTQWSNPATPSTPH